MEFKLTPNAVKVRAPGFAEMVCLGMGGWKDQPILYTKEAPVIMAKDWGDPRPQAQFGVAASIAKPMFDAVRPANLLEQIYIDPGWKAQIPGWEFADGKDRLMLKQMLGADDLGRFYVVGNDGALLPGTWSAENILPEHLRTRVSVYHGKAADGPVFDHFLYRLKDLPIEFGEAGTAAVQVQQLRAAGIDARAAAQQLLDEFDPRLTADSFQRIAKQTLAQLDQHPSLEY